MKLDGTVDGQDFIIWNTNKFTDSNSWVTGDFNGDALVDGGDFIIWNVHKFISADTLLQVPEPALVSMFVLGIIGAVRRRRQQ